MKYYSVHTATFTATLFAAMISLSSAHAIGSKNVEKNGSRNLTAQQSYGWYDGDRKHTVWLNPQRVAEFNPNQKSGSSLKSVYSSAKEIPADQASIRLWQLDETITSKSAIQSLKNNVSLDRGNNYSPVLHDSPSSTGRMRALPGNIIVHLNANWGETEVNNWVNINKVTIVKQLNIGSNVFILKTAPGLASLELANKLYNTDEVVAAYPNWWTEVSKR